MAMKPSLFIGSSTEGLKVAKTLQLLLENTCETTIWSQGVFGLGESTLESLVNSLDDFDYAALILTPDDLLESRGAKSQSPRDNVLFELGLFMGSLGRQRTFIVYEKTSKIKLPSDLAGVSAATYTIHSSGRLESSLGTTATRLENQMEKLGVRNMKNITELTNAAHNVTQQQVPQTVTQTIGSNPSSEHATFGATQSGRHPFFINKPYSDIDAAIAQSKRMNRPLFLVIYNDAHPSKSQLYYSLGCFLDYFTTKKLVDDHFVSALVASESKEAAKLVPSDDPLENCLWVVLSPEGEVLRREGVCANPDEGLKCVRSVIAQATHE